MGKIIIFIGGLVMIIGLMIHYFPNAFNWFGNLPGDFKSTDGNIKFYFPLMSMILISLVINVLIRIYKNFL